MVDKDPAQPVKTVTVLLQQPRLSMAVLHIRRVDNAANQHAGHVDKATPFAVLRDLLRHSVAPRALPRPDVDDVCGDAPLPSLHLARAGQEGWLTGGRCPVPAVEIAPRRRDGSRAQGSIRCSQHAWATGKIAVTSRADCYRVTIRGSPTPPGAAR